jgi:hypothetical protein
MVRVNPDLVEGIHCQARQFESQLIWIGNAYR